MLTRRAGRATLRRKVCRDRLAHRRHRPTRRAVCPHGSGGVNPSTPPLLLVHRHNPVVAETLSLKEAAERVGVSPATLRRWAREGVIPEVDGTGEWTTAAVAHARIVARLRDRGHKLEHIKQAGEQGRLAYGYIEDMFGTDRPRRSLSRRPPSDTGLEPALIERFWVSIGLAGQPARGAHRRGRPGAALCLRRAGRGLPARGVPPALPGVWPGALADRRRRGAALPPLRARAADPRGRAGAPDGRGDGGPRARPAAARLADDGLRPPALPPALRGAGRGRPHGVGARGRGHRPRARPDRDRVRGPRRLHALHGGGGRGGGAVVGRALRRGRDEHAARGRAGREDDRRRGDGRRPGRGRAGRLGGGLHLAVRRAAGAAHRRPSRHDALPRRRLLRARREPDLARGGAGARRRGARERRRGRGGRRLVAPRTSSRSAR